MSKVAGHVAPSLIYLWKWLALPCCLLSFVGCGADGPMRIALSGKVTQADQPIKQGAISLTPAEGHRGVAANTAIKDGHYQFTRTDGPGPGPYKVTILVTYTKDEMMKRRQAGQNPQAQWDFEIKVPELGSPTEDFQLKTK